MTDKELVRRLKGRRIVDVKLNKFRTGVKVQSREGWTYDPHLILEDGSELHFTVEETEHGVYGVAPVLRKAEVN